MKKINYKGKEYKLLISTKVQNNYTYLTILKKIDTAIDLKLSYNDFIQNFGMKDAFENLKDMHAKDLLENLSSIIIPTPKESARYVNKHAVGNPEALNLLKQSDPEQLVKFDSDVLVSQESIWCVGPKDACMLLQMSTAKELIKICGLENSVKLLKGIKEKLNDYGFKEGQANELSNISSLLDDKINELDKIKLNQKEEVKDQKTYVAELPEALPLEDIFDKNLTEDNFSFDFSKSIPTDHCDFDSLLSGLSPD